jgi:hypothetical protein
MDQKREQFASWRRRRESMEEGPFRMPTTPDRGAHRPPAPANPTEPPVEEQNVHEEPKPVQHRNTPVRHSKLTLSDDKSKKPLIVAGVIVAVVLVALIVWALLPKSNAAKPPIDSGKYQAVSFNDGQLYFGKLSFVNDQYMKLTDIYYLQPQSESSGTSDNLQKATANQNFKLVKFTDVIYGPEDEMTIPKSQVLFYENIASGGKVSQLIAQYKKSH